MLPFVPFYVKMIPHCLNNVEVWALGWLSSLTVVCFYIQVCVFGIGSVFWIIAMLKNEVFSNQIHSRWYCIANKNPMVNFS